ncbi:MAG: cytidine deaminase [Bacteroidales bacterium]|nr:cytidine deaminase [Bacteroidales bacterium]
MQLRKVTTVVEISSDTTSEDALHETLRNAAAEAAHMAYAPYSNFHVGAAARLANGEIITGSNQENAAYPSGLCAERVTLFYANAHYPNVAVTHLMIYAENADGVLPTPITPCGACRQVIIEKETTQGSPIEICLAGADTTYIISSASQLMPLSFLPDSLNQK